MIDAYVAAEKAVLLGKSYQIGERRLTREDLPEIRAGRAEWEAKLSAAVVSRPMFAKASWS